MKNISSLLFIMLLLSFNSQAQNRLSLLDLESSNTPQHEFFLIDGKYNAPEAACEEENPHNNEFINGFNCSSTSEFKIANDLTVAAGETFTLTQIKTYFITEFAISNIAVTYYDDNNGLPGTIIGEEASVTIDNQQVIGNAYGLNVYDVDMSVTPFTFEGRADQSTTYWIHLSVTDASSSYDVYWLIVGLPLVGQPTAVNDGQWRFEDMGVDGSYIWKGECDVLSTNTTDLSGFNFYPNPTNDILTLNANSTIESVSLFNMLGQKVKSQSFDAKTGTISLADLAKGTYILKAIVDGQAGTFKVQKN